MTNKMQLAQLLSLLNPYMMIVVLSFKRILVFTNQCFIFELIYDSVL